MPNNYIYFKLYNFLHVYININMKFAIVIKM